MTEDPASESPLSPLEAVEYLRKLRPIEVTIRARMEGLAWMVWSILTAATFLAFATARPSGPEAALFILPWLAAGLIASLVIRRSAAIPLPPLKIRDWAALGGATAAITIITVFGIVLSLGVPTAGLVLMAVSVLAFPLTRMFLGQGITGRTSLVISAIGVVTAISLMAMRAGDITSAVASACVCGTWFLIGAWEALRG